MAGGDAKQEPILGCFYQAINSDILPEDMKSTRLHQLAKNRILPILKSGLI